ncbi:MAG: ABC transporter permease [Eubacteriales bacterium]|nr:ABC transporter permease [Eubacteriales bacterium]
MIKSFWRKFGRHSSLDLLRLFVIILVAFALNTIVLLVSGKDVSLVYSSLVKGAFGDTYNFARTLRWSLPLVFTGLSFSVSARAGIFNIGAEGQLYLGAFAAAWVGFTFQSLPAYIVIPFACLLAMLVGMLYSMLAGWIMERFHASIVVVTLMMNYIAILFTEYLTRYPFYVPGTLGDSGSTAYISEAAHLSKIFQGTNATTGVFLALVVAVLVFLFNNYTVAGYECRVIGSNERFSKFSGLKVKQRRMLVFAISGMIAGLGGAIEVLGVHYRFIVSFASGLGFDGIVVSLLANGNPLGIPIAALFMGAMSSGSITVEMFGKVPKAMTDILMGIIIMIVTVRYVPGFITKIKQRRIAKSENIAGVGRD